MKKFSRVLVGASAAALIAASMSAAPASASGHGDEPSGRQLGKLAQACAYERGYESLGHAFGNRPHGNMSGGVPAYLARHCGYDY